MKENCLQWLQQKKKKCLKVRRWRTMKRRKYKTEDQVKVVKISTILYSINHCQNEKFSKAAVTFLVYDSMFVNSYWIT